MLPMDCAWNWTAPFPGTRANISSNLCMCAAPAHRIASSRPHLGWFRGNSHGVPPVAGGGGAFAAYFARLPRGPQSRAAVEGGDQPDAAFAVARHHFAGGVAEAVAVAGLHQGEPGRHGIQEGLAGRGLA